MRWAALENPAGWDRAVPTVCVANHTNWWDGFFAFLLSRAAGWDGRLLMDAGQLARYPPFRRVGVLRIRRDPPRAAYDDLRAADAELRPGSVLWIFPSGARRPERERPARFERGAAHLVLAHGAPVRICPVAFRYGYLGEQLPEAFALTGRPWIVAAGQGTDRRALTEELERAVAGAVDRLDARLAAESLSDFRLLVQGRLSVNKRMDRFRHAVGLLRGPFEARNG
ncbi:MAG TPA: lysophospholipid acyltransferase family protein [Gemmatimonadales bacterium]|nr:lysophospholipid acyltransferase family protein [Gemmatimonadales bacterium]